jgi:imidazole glycerol-phosphate synthase subunit HisH
MSRIEVAIVDYGIGNLKSVANAVEHLGAVPRVSSDPAVLDACDRLILPGVGAFPHGIAELTAQGLRDFLGTYVASGRRCLGICLGMQLLHTCSMEFTKTEGLGLLDGTVDHLTRYATDPDRVYRMPNVGWLPLERVTDTGDLASRMLSGVTPDDAVYFIHSYGVPATAPDVAAVSRCDDLRFASVVARDNLVGTQFHPEKSRETGLGMLKSFIF